MLMPLQLHGVMLRPKRLPSASVLRSQHFSRESIQDLFVNEYDTYLEIVIAVLVVKDLKCLVVGSPLLRMWELRAEHLTELFSCVTFTLLQLLGPVKQPIDPSCCALELSRNMQN